MQFQIESSFFFFSSFLLLVSECVPFLLLELQKCSFISRACSSHQGGFFLLQWSHWKCWHHSRPLLLNTQPDPGFRFGLARLRTSCAFAKTSEARFEVVRGSVPATWGKIVLWTRRIWLLNNRFLALRHATHFFKSFFDGDDWQKPTWRDAVFWFSWKTQTYICTQTDSLPA